MVLQWFYVTNEACFPQAFLFIYYVCYFLYVVKTDITQHDNSSVMGVQSCEILFPTIVGNMGKWEEHELQN